MSASTAADTLPGTSTLQVARLSSNAAVIGATSMPLISIPGRSPANVAGHPPACPEDHLQRLTLVLIRSLIEEGRRSGIPGFTRPGIPAK